ncbi:ras-related and estrogen-regulated growth inhibitor-like protein isoform X2 [Struthio camelus]|uniref:ras-related and estrogen-regulated growth inhibitor-like protein isoform X2 n=1 Tax=Struthio camelus TaxID=8801 RepID=UPI003603BB73
MVWSPRIPWVLWEAVAEPLGPPARDSPARHGSAAPAAPECQLHPRPSCPPGGAWPRCPENGSKRARHGSGQRGEVRRFIGEYGDMEFIYSHNLTVDGREILFHIWDVPYSQDQADEGSSEEKRIQWADSFVLVYSICDRASFNILPLKVQFIKAAKEGLSQEKVPIVIVGNKRDLHHQRVVSSEEGRLLALSLDCGFYEVSAAEAYHGALMVFHGLAERIPDTKLTLKKGTRIRGIVKSMSAVFARKRTDSL